MTVQFPTPTPTLQTKMRSRVRNLLTHSAAVAHRLGLRRRPNRLTHLSIDDVPPSLFAAPGRPTISVCVLTRNCAGTVTATLTVLAELRAAGLIDDVVVIDADSPDGTARIAAGHGARIVSESSLLPEFGPVLGKGDAMWRAQAVLTGEIVVFQDGDLADYAARHVLGVAGALLRYPWLRFAKGTYRRHLRTDTDTIRDGGGRVSRLMARPLLKALYPDLHAFSQPLSGEVAITRELLGALPMVTGYGVETGMLIDVYRRVGLGAMAEIDLRERANNHQSLTALEGMAEVVAQTVLSRAAAEGRIAGSVPAPTERPPFATVGVRQDSLIA